MANTFKFPPINNKIEIYMNGEKLVAGVATDWEITQDSSGTVDLRIRVLKEPPALKDVIEKQLGG